MYGKAEVVSTISPSMDIQVASNFERYLYYRLGEDAAEVASLMEQFKEQGNLSVEKEDSGVIDPLFRAIRGGTQETLEVIERYHAQHQYVLDPHTALGVYAAESAPSSVPTICLATAHPAKFTETIERAIGSPSDHPKLARIKEAPTRSCALPNEVDAIRAYVSEHV
jgi:threonine synthase